MRTDGYVERKVPRMSDSSFAAVSAAVFVVCRADKPTWYNPDQTPSNGTKIWKRFSYQSERSTFGGGLFRLQSKIGLSINRTGNIISECKSGFRLVERNATKVGNTADTPNSPELLLFKRKFGSHPKGQGKCDPGGVWACNLWIRSMTVYRQS